MKYLWLLCLSCLLVGCDFFLGINSMQFPPQARGVADGLPLAKRQLTPLQEYGVILADGREGTHIILPADKIFRETIDRVTINPDFQSVLNDLVHILNGYPRVKLEIVGHSDGVMSRDLDEKKSSEYAVVLSNYLTSAGLSPARIISVRGVGNSQPIIRADNVDARAVNRRVEVIALAPIK